MATKKTDAEKRLEAYYKAKSGNTSTISTDDGERTFNYADEGIRNATGTVDRTNQYLAAKYNGAGTGVTGGSQLNNALYQAAQQYVQYQNNQRAKQASSGYSPVSSQMMNTGLANTLAVERQKYNETQREAQAKQQQQDLQDKLTGYNLGSVNRIVKDANAKNNISKNYTTEADARRISEINNQLNDLKNQYTSVNYNNSQEVKDLIAERDSLLPDSGVKYDESTLGQGIRSYQGMSDPEKAQAKSDTYTRRYSWNSDYKQNSSYTPSVNSSGEFEHVLYDYINGNPNAIKQVESGNTTTNPLGGTSSTNAWQNFANNKVSSEEYLRNLTTDERKTFNYIYNTQGYDAAWEYIQEIKPILTQRQAQKEAALDTGISDLGFASEVGQNLESITLSPQKTAGYMLTAADYLTNGHHVDENSSALRASRRASNIRSDTGENVSEFNAGIAAKLGANENVQNFVKNATNFGYQTGMSMADFVYNNLISGGFFVNSGAAGAVGAAETASNLAENVSLLLMGTAAASDALVEAKENGYDSDSAMALATVSGLAEIVTEKVSVDALLDAKLLTDNKGLYVLKNLISEGSEEVGSDAINWTAEWAWDIIQGTENSEWKRLIRQYEEEGATENEAFVMAFKQKALTAMSDFAGGAISGGILGAGQAVQSAISGRKVGSSINSDTNENRTSDIESNINYGIRTGDEAIANLAREVQEQYQTTGTVKDSDIGRLAEANAQHEAEVISDIQEYTAEETQKAQATTNTVNNLMKAAEEISNGGQVSDKTIAKLAESQDIANIINQTSEGAKIDENTSAEDRQTLTRTLVTELAKEGGANVIQDAMDTVVESNEVSEDTIDSVMANKSAVGLIEQVTGQNFATMDESRQRDVVSAFLEGETYKARQESINEKAISVAAKSYGDSGARVLQERYDQSGVSNVDEYVKGMRAMYNAGTQNVDLPYSSVTTEYISNLVKEKGISSNFKTEVLASAFFAGQNDADTSKNTKTGGNVNEAAAENSDSGEGRDNSVAETGSDRSVPKRRGKAGKGTAAGGLREQGIQSILRDQRKAYGEEAESSEELGKKYGFRNGTDKKTTEIREQFWNDEMRDIKNRFDSRGFDVVFVSGRIEQYATDSNGDRIQNKDGTYKTELSRGMYIPPVGSGRGTIIIQADNVNLSITQIALHEEFHAILTGLNKADRAAAIDKALEFMISKGYDEVKIRQLAEKYIKKYGWNTMKMSEQQILEEVFADAYAGIDVFDYLTNNAGAAEYSEGIREYAEGFEAKDSENGDVLARQSIEELSDGTQYVYLENRISLDKNGNELTKREAYNNLVDLYPNGIKMPDGDTILLLRRISQKDMYNELAKRWPKKYKNVRNIGEINDIINKNMDDVIKLSYKTEFNVPDLNGRHAQNEIVSFDTRTVNIADDRSAYRLELSVATLNTGEKVAYAKKFIEADSDLMDKIKKEKKAMSNKSQLNSSLDDKIAQTDGDVNKNIKSSSEIDEIVNESTKNRDGSTVVDPDLVQTDSILSTIEPDTNKSSYELYENEDQKQEIKVTKSGFSVTSKKIRGSGRSILQQVYENNGYSAGFIKNKLEQMDSFAKFMKDKGLEYHFIGLNEVNNAKLVLDKRTGKITISAMVKNGEYPVNFDFTKICAKRVAISNLINELAKRPGRKGGSSMLEEIDLSAGNIFKINQILLSEGYDTACLGCFVEARRANIQDWATTFVQKYNKAVRAVNPNAEYFNFSDVKLAAASNMSEEEVKALTKQLDGYKKGVKNSTAKKTNELKVNQFVKNVSSMQKLLRTSDLITANGRTALHSASPELESLILSHWGTSTPKSMEVFTPYNNEIALMTGTPGGKELSTYLKKIGGIRSQSFSDFQIQHFLDVAQKTADMEARRFVAHTYTKVASRAWLFGMTGEKINMSVMFNIDPNLDWRNAGLRANGEYFVGDKATADQEVKEGRERTPNQSIDFNEAVRIQSTPGYTSNCGIIGVGYCYNHIMKMLADKNIRYVIPYHKSGLPTEFANAAHINLASDYTAVQNTTVITGFKALKQADSVPSFATWGQKQKTGNTKNTDYTYGATVKTDSSGSEDSTGKIYSMRDAFKNSGMTGQEFMSAFLADMNENDITVTTKTAKGGAGHGSFDLYGELEKTANDKKLTQAERDDAPRIVANKYIEWCLNNGSLPLFYEFADNENYYKLLYDFNVYDYETEKYAPQLPVTTTYPENVLDMVDNYMKNEDAANQELEGHFESALERTYEATAIKNSSEVDEEDTEDDEIRHSSETDSETEQSLREENEFLRTQYFDMLHHLNQLDNSKTLRTNANKLAAKIAADYQSTMNKTELKDRINRLVQDYIVNAHQDQYIAYENAKIYAVEIAKDVINSAKQLNTSAKAQYDELRAYLMDKNGYVLNPADRADMTDYNKFRQQNFGKINLKNSGLPVDTAYMELQEKYGTTLFPADITHPADQLIRISEVLQDFSSVYENPHASAMEETVEYCANDILNSIVDDIAAVPSNNTTKERAAFEKGKQKGIDYARKAISAERTYQNNRVNRIQEYYEKQAEERKNRKDLTETKKKLMNIAKRLKNKKTLAANRALIDSYIKDLDTISFGMTAKKLDDLSELKNWYYQQQAEHPDTWIPDKRIEKQLDRLQMKHINELTIDQIRDLTEVLQGIENEIQTHDRTIGTADRRSVFQQAISSIDVINATKGIKESSKTGAIDRYFKSGTLSPMRAVKRYVGYHENTAFYQRVVELNDGQRNMLDYQRRAYDLFTEWTSDAKFMDSITGAKAQLIDIGYGVKITPAMRMSIYLHSKNADNMRHIEYGGLTIPNMKDYKKGNLAFAYGQGTRTVKLTVNDVKRIASGITAKEKAFADAAMKYFNGMSQQEINRVSEQLKGYSLAIVDNYMPINTNPDFTKKEFGSVKFDGTIEGMGFLVERVNAANAIMLRDLTDVLKQSIDMTSKYVGLAIPVRNFYKVWSVGTGTLDAEGYQLQSLMRDLNDAKKKGNAQLEETLKKELEDMTGLKDLPSNQKEQFQITDFLNHHRTETSQTLPDSIRQKWGNSGVRYIEKMMADLQNTSGKDRAEWEQVLNKVRSNYAGAVLTLNLSVAAKQTASYPTAAAVLGWQPLAKTLASTRKVDMSIVNKYTPLLWYRSQGFSTQELGDIRKNTNMNPLMKMLTKPALNWIQFMDVATTKKLWTASEYYVLQNNKQLQDRSDEFYKQVAEVYNRVIEETQPNYTTMQRPQLLREDSALLQSVVMFKTQPFQNFNVLYDAIGEFNARKSDLKADLNGDNKELKAAYKEAGKNLAKAISSQVVQLAVFAAMTFAWNAFRLKLDDYEDEDGKMTFLTVSKKIGLDMVSGAASMIPFGSELYEVFSSIVFGDTYYGVDSIATSSVSDLFETIVNTYSNVKDIADKAREGENIDWNKERFVLDEFLSSVSKIAGIPYDNVKNLVQAGYRHISRAVEGKYLGEYHYLMLTANPSSKSSKYYDNLFKAYKNDPEQYEAIRAAMVDSGYFKEDTIKTNLKKKLAAKGISDADQETLEGSDLYQKATEEQQERALDGVINAIAAGETESEENGLSEDTMFLYETALAIVDQPNDSGKYGSYKIDEVESAIDMLTGLTDEQKHYLFGLKSKSANPY